MAPYSERCTSIRRCRAVSKRNTRPQEGEKVEQPSPAVPTVEVVTEVGSEVTMMETMNVAPMVAALVDGERETGVMVTYDALVNGTADRVEVQLALSVEQSIELQLRLESGTREALLIAELMN